MVAGWIGILDLLVGLALLIILALRGVNILLASILCTLIVIATNALSFAESLTNDYISGDPVLTSQSPNTRCYSA